MTGPGQVAMMVGPLACYLSVLAVWHGGRTPRVVSGTVDAAWLMFGLIGLVGFGPIGDALARPLFGTGPFARGGLVVTLVALGVALSGKASRRLVVYNVEPDELIEAIAGLGLGLTRCSDGFEGVAGAVALRVEPMPRIQVVGVEARGAGAERLLASLLPPLRERLDGRPRRSSPIARPLFWLAVLTLVGPLLAWTAARPAAREAVRAWLNRP